MPTPRPEPIRRAEWLFGGASCAALLLAAYAVLRPPAAGPAGEPAALAELRAELAALRHSVELTRGQMSAPGDGNAIAEVEQRLARVEASARAALPRPVPSTSPGAAPQPEADAEPRLADGSPRYVSLVATSSAVAVEQLADGSLAVKNRDPELAGTSMIVKARTAGGQDESVTITIPPAS